MDYIFNHKSWVVINKNLYVIGDNNFFKRQAALKHLYILNVKYNFLSTDGYLFKCKIQNDLIPNELAMLMLIGSNDSIKKRVIIEKLKRLLKNENK